MSKNLHTIAAKTYLDEQKVRRPLSLPIYQGTTFQSPSGRNHGEDFKAGNPVIYQRFGHPTLEEAGRKIAQLEGAEAGLVFSSGMAAITTSLLTVLKAGDHVVAQREIFAQTYTFLDVTCRKLGIETTFVDGKDPVNFSAAITPRTTLLYIESPSNPLLDITDIAAVAGIAGSGRLLLFIDSTFASPVCQSPLTLGADLVIHSGTKYLGGHSDVMSGAIAGPRDLIARIHATQVLLGGILDPHAAWLLLRGIKTLGVRMERIVENAATVAHWLTGHHRVMKVYYPWLDTSAGHTVARRQMRAGGGVVSFEVHGGLAAARKLLDNLNLIPIATSLGGVETMIEIPYELDFHEDALGKETVSQRAVTPSLVRLAVGIENIHDILDDLKQSLDQL